MSRSSKKTFEVIHSSFTLDKVDLECVETVKPKPNRNGSGFITYSNTIIFASKWLDSSGYIITQWENVGKRIGYHMVQKLGITKKVIKFGKLVKKMTS